MHNILSFFLFLDEAFLSVFICFMIKMINDIKYIKYLVSLKGCLNFTDGAEGLYMKRVFTSSNIVRRMLDSQ